MARPGSRVRPTSFAPTRASRCGPGRGTSRRTSSGRRGPRSRRRLARLASLGVNGAGLTVMLAVFASTGRDHGPRGGRRRWHVGGRAQAPRGAAGPPGGALPRGTSPRRPPERVDASASRRDRALRCGARRQGSRAGGRRTAPRRDRRRPTGVVSRLARPVAWPRWRRPFSSRTDGSIQRQSSARGA